MRIYPQNTCITFQMDNCSLCFQDIPDSVKYTISECGDAFHCSCIVNWFRRHDSSDCPKCEQAAVGSPMPIDEKRRFQIQFSAWNNQRQAYEKRMHQAIVQVNDSNEKNVKKEKELCEIQRQVTNWLRIATALAVKAKSVIQLQAINQKLQSQLLSDSQIIATERQSIASRSLELETRQYELAVMIADNKVSARFMQEQRVKCENQRRELSLSQKALDAEISRLKKCEPLASAPMVRKVYKRGCRFCGYRSLSNCCLACKRIYLQPRSENLPNKKQRLIEILETSGIKGASCIVQTFDEEVLSFFFNKLT